jgi:hypothetical protein
VFSLHKSGRKTQLQINHAHHHGAARIKRQVLESPARIEAAHAVIERMRGDTISG